MGKFSVDFCCSGRLYITNSDNIILPRGNSGEKERGELITYLMARKKTEPKKEAFAIHSFSLTTITEETLKRLSGEASDQLGWTVSSSAIMRALLRYAGESAAADSRWASSQLFPFVEREIAGGVVWGKKK